MNWASIINRYRRSRRSTLKVVNPRYGTSVIPLDEGDEGIFFNYLQDKIHSLYFEGNDSDFYDLIKVLEKTQGVVVQRMNIVEGNRDRLMHIHLRLPNTQEIRRVIKLT